MDIPFPSYTGHKPYSFVCYSHDDKELVYAELLHLQDAGINVWYDEGIRPGSEWSDTLASRIENCRVFLYFVTPKSVASEHCRREVSFALEQSCEMFAVHLEPTELPRGLRLTLGNRQAILKYDNPASIYREKLIQAVRDILGLTPNSSAPGKKNISTIETRVTRAAAPLAPANTQSSPTIAVLPFLNLSSDPAQEYFSEGMSEDILDGLGRNQGLVVRARQSSFLFKGSNTDPRQIADQLEVAYLVSGSIRALANRIRVTARLTDVTTNTDVWSERFDREVNDIFAVQDEITESIVRALGVHFSGINRRRVNIDAYQAYLLGRYHQARFELDSAIKSFHEALELDSSYADAYAALAQIYTTIEWVCPPNLEEIAAEAQKFTAKALDRDPKQPIALGLNALRLPAQQAIDELDALIRQHRSDPDLQMFYSFVLRRVGRFDLVESLMDQQVSLDPLSPLRFWQRANEHALSGRLQAAKDDCRKCESMGVPAAMILSQVALVERDFKTLETQCERPASDWREAPIWRTLFSAAGAFLEGDADQVELILENLGDKSDDLPFYVRFFLAMFRGETETATDFYEAALERGEPTPLFSIQGTAAYRTLFPDFYRSARYFAILQKLELDEESLAKLSVPPLPF